MRTALASRLLVFTAILLICLLLVVYARQPQLLLQMIGGNTTCPPVQPAAVNPGLLLVSFDLDLQAGAFYALDGAGRLTRLNTANNTSVTGNLDGDWSPQAGLTVFVQGAQEAAELYVADTSGQARRLTNNDREETSPVWSPDGRSIAFVSRATEGSYRAYIMCGDGSGLHPIAPDVSAHTLTWSPDGQSLAIQGYLPSRNDANTLTVIDAQSGRILHRLDNSAANTLPLWSPDGRSIAYTSNAGPGRSFRLYLWSLETEEQRALVGQHDVTQFSWSPDGSALAYTSGIGGVRPILRLLTIDDSMDINLLPDNSPHVVMRSQAWSPDGCLAYTAMDQVGAQLQARPMIQPAEPPLWQHGLPISAIDSDLNLLPVSWIYPADDPTPCAVFPGTQ